MLWLLNLKMRSFGIRQMRLKGRKVKGQATEQKDKTQQITKTRIFFPSL